MSCVGRTVWNETRVGAAGNVDDAVIGFDGSVVGAADDDVVLDASKVVLLNTAIPLRCIPGGT